MDIINNINEAREFIHKRDDYKCFYCGIDFNDHPEAQRQLDHIRPKYKYNDHSVDNIILSCWDCNKKKNTRELNECEINDITKYLNDKNTGLSSEFRESFTNVVEEYFLNNNNYYSNCYLVINLETGKYLLATTKLMISNNTNIHRNSLIDLPGRKAINNYYIVTLKRGYWV